MLGDGSLSTRTPSHQDDLDAAYMELLQGLCVVAVKLYPHLTASEEGGDADGWANTDLLYVQR